MRSYTIKIEIVENIIGEGEFGAFPLVLSPSSQKIHLIADGILKSMEEENETCELCDHCKSRKITYHIIGQSVSVT